MADELDPTLEAKLRVALRSEADALPLLVRPEDVDRRRSARRRRPRAVAASLLGVAAVLAILVGTGAIGRLSPAGPGASPSPSQTARPLESFATLVALLSSGDTPLLQGEQASATDPGTGQGEVDLGVLPPAVHLKFALECLGGSLDIVIRHGDTDLGTHHTDCALRPFVVQTPDPTLFGHAPYDGTEHVFVRAAGGVRWRIVVAATLEPGPSFILVEPSATPSSDAEGCAPIRQPSQARSFIVRNIAAGLDYGDVLTSDVALRVEPGSWPLADLAPLSADSRGALGFDVGSHCVRTWDLTFASLNDAQAALAAGTEPQLAAGSLTSASDNHTLQVFGLPVGDLIVRVVVTWDTVPGLDLTDVYLIHLTVLPPVPSASGVQGQP
jgi:hypothetical protein